jgi:putative heme-binding domain-containing protein
LVKAARMRKLRPSGELDAIAGLIDAEDESLRLSAIDAAGAWQITGLRDRLVERATADDTTVVERRALLSAVAAMGGDSTSAILSLCKGGPAALRLAAIEALTALDVQSASAELVSLMRQESAADPSMAVVALLDRNGGAASLTEALSEQKLPADTAKLAVRAVRSVARQEPALVAALSAAGGITGGVAVLSPSELAAIVDEVASRGDAKRGEAVFRRAEQACLKCHSIAGAGGRVGPDLVSIGASAQVDYLVESILQPNAKIKENYHSLLVVADGRITSGIRVRETDQELVLRDVEDREVAIPLDAIELKKDGDSLMPVGLADSLTRAELVDLVRFLSELGKVGPYAASSAPIARRWEALTPSPAAAALVKNGLPDQVPGNDPGMRWGSVYSCVSGELPLEAIPPIGDEASAWRVVRCQCDVATAGEIGLKLTGPVERLWFDGNAIKLGDGAMIDMSAGAHTITLLTRGPSDKLRLELTDVPGSAAQVQLVGGK